MIRSFRRSRSATESRSARKCSRGTATRSAWYPITREARFLGVAIPRRNAISAEPPITAGSSALGKTCKAVTDTFGSADRTGTSSWCTSSAVIAGVCATTNGRGCSAAVFCT